jgi:hypothetical protein
MFARQMIEELEFELRPIENPDLQGFAREQAERQLRRLKQEVLLDQLP